jgi:predicted HTH domain antitoxin
MVKVLGATVMTQTKLTLNLPDYVVEALGATPEEATRSATQAILLHLLREGCISQGRVAELLGITRHDVLDLMAKYDIPSGALTIEELREEVDRAAAYLQRQQRSVGED